MLAGCHLSDDSDECSVSSTSVIVVLRWVAGVAVIMASLKTPLAHLMAIIAAIVASNGLMAEGSHSMLEDGIAFHLALLHMSASPFSLEENVIVRGLI